MLAEDFRFGRYMFNARGAGAMTLTYYLPLLSRLPLKHIHDLHQPKLDTTPMCIGNSGRSEGACWLPA